MKPILIVAALAAAPCFAPVSAQTPAAGGRTQIVSFADLDLTRKADVRKLDRRIGRAVKQVCGTASDTDLKGRNEVRRCLARTSESLSAERGRALAWAAQPSQMALASED